MGSKQTPQVLVYRVSEPDKRYPLVPETLYRTIVSRSAARVIAV